MTVMRSIIISVMILLFPLSASAQMTDKAEISQINQKYDLGLSKRPSFPWLDLSKLHFSQSYAVSFFSGNGYSGSQALYNGTIVYQLSHPLTLSLNMGILHDPSALWGSQSLTSTTAFLPSGRLDWRPSENFLMSIGFETVPAFYNGCLYDRRYGFWR